MKATGLTSGVTVDIDWAAYVTLVDARVIRERISVDRAEALEAAGLSERTDS